MAYAAFADAPVDVAVVEVGMGGSWDATNVADATVAVITADRRRPRAYLGDAAGRRSPREKAGIIKPGATVVVRRAGRRRGRGDRRAGRRGRRDRALGGPRLRRRAPGRRPSAARCCALQGLRGEYDEVFLPLYGAHQAQNAALALAAVEAFLGEEPLDAELVRDAFARGDLAGPARGDPAQPDDRARRRAQPARRRGRRGRARGLVRCSTR